MRKFLRVTAIVGLALLVAAPAMALDFKFGAEYRVRFYTNNGGNQFQLGNDEGVGGAPAGYGGFSGRQAGVQLRIRPRFDVTDDNGNMTATLRLEIGDIEWGNGGGAAGVANGGPNGTPTTGVTRVGNSTGGSLGADGVNVETKWAYVDFATPWGVPLRWRAGLQPWYENKGIIIDDDVAGVRAYGKAGVVSYEVGWYRALNVCPANGTGNNAGCQVGGNQNQQDNNYDYYEAKVGANIAKWLNPTAYYIFGDNRATNTTVNSTPGNNPNFTKPVTANFFGVQLAGDFDFLRYDLDFVYGNSNGGVDGNYTGNTGNRIKAQGWVLDGGVHIPVGPLLFHLVGSYATGDKQNGGNSEAMPWISPSWNGAGGLYELIGSGGVFDQVDVTQDYPAGLWMVGGGVEYRPVKALWTRLVVGYAGFVSKRSNCAYSNGRPSGQCFGPVYGGKGYTAPTVVAGQVTAGGEGGIAGQSALGTEVSLRADYDLWTNFKVQGAMGWLFPSSGSAVGEYVLQLLYSF